ncbi:anthrax toxin receptor-like [Ailuropoda melanoleuca]|uniref:anthrax toxin receptor-like n=1 Tax=Ailuropoda melanoleuca TaxID=9646 RepID=UPI0014946D6F|nr:anthrax toxin receptor-like [Ailuropoda melanoleuca]
MTCPGVTIDSPDQEVFVEVSLNNGLSFISNGANITSKNCVNARNAPEAPQTPVPDTPIPPVVPPPPPSKTYMPDISPLFLALLLAALILIPLLVWCIWRYCFKRTVKEPPQVRVIQREPVGKCIQTCPTMIIPCGCQEGRIRQIESRKVVRSVAELL